jgi:hypothetical protein
VATYLQVAYTPHRYWVHPLLAAVTAKPSLARVFATWRTSALSDLAFSIDTRLGAISELVRMVNTSLNALAGEIEAQGNVDGLLAGGYAFTFDDDEHVRRALALLSAYTTECDTLLENLTEFYRRFSGEYLGQTVSKAEGEAFVRGLAAGQGWAEALTKVRNMLIHRFAPWLAFEDKSPVQPRFEPVLALDWRPERLGPSSSVSLETLRDVRANLLKAADVLMHHLVARVNAIP